MLTNIYIENVAVIEKASIDFGGAFNVLTGETGAGKSIIIDSINAIMGQRVSKELIRSGEKQAFISAVFSDVSEEAKKKLDEWGIDSDEGEYILQRTISAQGKNTCRINGRPTTLSSFKDISPYLINIYGQNEGYDFMTADSHIKYIDAIGDYHDVVEDYKSKYAVYSDVKRKLDSMSDNIRDRERKIDLLQYQIGEIEDADPTPGEIEELAQRRQLLMNGEKIRTGAAQAYSALTGEDEGGILSSLEDVSGLLEEISQLYPDLDSISERIRSAYEELNDCHYELRGIYDDLDFDPNELEEVEERRELLSKLSAKYGGTVEEILEYCDNAKKELESLISYDINKGNLERKFEEAKKELTLAARKLTEVRTKAAEKFSADVMRELKYLDMPNVVMVPNITSCGFTPNGCDVLELLISPNPGEEPKPLSKIASGGELSRLMLAVKTIIAEKDEIDTLIFDEIDTGISGSAASKVGSKLEQLSQTHQVLCITHQAQIAALASEHLFISKKVEKGKTFTVVKELDFEERKRELSRIIDGTDYSEVSLQHAEQMLRRQNTGKA